MAYSNCAGFPNMSKLPSFNANTYLEYSYRKRALNCALCHCKKDIGGGG